MASRVLTVKLLGEAKGALGAMDQTEKRAGGLSGAMGKMGKAVGAAFLVGGAAAAGFAAASVKMAADFEESMSEVQTLLPDLDKEGFGKLRQSVLDFSKEMGIATDEAVPALYQAISAGVPSDNVIDFMGIAAKASIGGVTDLETAVDGITSVVNAYGSEVIDAQAASDVMFSAVKAGKTDFESLSKSLFNVIPTAASLGVSFEEVAAGLATMTAQGVPTSVATTQLRQAFVEASKGGSNLDKALQELHGKGFANLMEDGFNAVDVFQGLRESMPEQEFKDLFGSVEAMNAALQITGPNFEAMNKNLNDAQNSAGALDSAFDTVSETANFKLDKAMNQIKVLMIEFGSIILPIVADFISGTLIPAFERLSGWFEKNRPQIESAIQTFAEKFEMMAGHFKTGLDTITPLLIAFGKWIFDNKPALVVAIVAIGAAIALALGPVSLAVVAILGMITAIGWLKDNWQVALDFIREKVIQVMDFLGSGKGLLILTVLLGPAGLVLGAVFNFRDAFGGAFGSIRDAVGNAIGAVIDKIGEFIGFVHNMVSAMAGSLGDIISNVTSFVDNMDVRFAPLLMLLGPAGALLTIWKFRDNFVDAFGAVRDFISGAIGTVSDVITGLGDTFQRVWDRISGIVDSIRGAVTDAKNAIADLPGAGAVSAAAGALTDPLGTAGDLARRGLGRLGFDGGGVVPGPVGAPRLIMAHAGETVLPTHKRGGFGGNNITINVTPGISDPVAIGQAIAEVLNAASRSNGPILRTGMVS